VIDASPVEALTLADRSTAKAQSAQVETIVLIGPIGKQSSISSSGAISWSHGITGTLSTTFGGDAAPPMTQAGLSTIDVRYLSDGFYMDMGDKLAQETGGKHWIRYGYDDMEKLAGASGGYLKDQMQNATPSQGVQPLLASGDVHKVGPEKVRDVQTVHYSGTIRPADFVGKNTHLTASELAAFRQQLQQSGITTETIDLWLDADGLPAKVTEKAHTSAGEMSTSVYYSGYGTKVSVSKPPADETLDIADASEEEQQQAA
jgi:hypothetical protein